MEEDPFFTINRLEGDVEAGEIWKHVLRESLREHKNTSGRIYALLKEMAVAINAQDVEKTRSLLKEANKQIDSVTTPQERETIVRTRAAIRKDKTGQYKKILKECAPFKKVKSEWDEFSEAEDDTDEDDTSEDGDEDEDEGEIEGVDEDGDESEDGQGEEGEEGEDEDKPATKKLLIK